MAARWSSMQQLSCLPCNHPFLAKPLHPRDEVLACWCNGIGAGNTSEGRGAQLTSCQGVNVTNANPPAFACCAGLEVAPRSLELLPLLPALENVRFLLQTLPHQNNIGPFSTSTIRLYSIHPPSTSIPRQHRQHDDQVLRKSDAPSPPSDTTICIPRGIAS